MCKDQVERKFQVDRIKCQGPKAPQLQQGKRGSGESGELNLYQLPHVRVPTRGTPGSQKSYRANSGSRSEEETDRQLHWGWRSSFQEGRSREKTWKEWSRPATFQRGRNACSQSVSKTDYVQFNESNIYPVIFLVYYLSRAMFLVQRGKEHFVCVLIVFS